MTMDLIMKYILDFFINKFLDLLLKSNQDNSILLVLTILLLFILFDLFYKPKK